MKAARERGERAVEAEYVQPVDSHALRQSPFFAQAGEAAGPAPVQRIRADAVRNSHAARQVARARHVVLQAGEHGLGRGAAVERLPMVTAWASEWAENPLVMPLAGWGAKREMRAPKSLILADSGPYSAARRAELPGRKPIRPSAAKYSTMPPRPAATV